ncbi:MAG: hypothetical protein ACYS9X_20875 [Planctomycetota bacterium]|jgi:hypothetical protein
MIRTHRIAAEIEEFELPTDTPVNSTVVVPTVKGTWKFKYGKHAYYFMNFRAGRGFSVGIKHLDIVRPGLERFKRAASTNGARFATLRCLSRRYHYDFSFLEQIMLMTVPHTVTDLGEGRYAINLWSYCGYLVVDCHTRTVTYHTMEDQGEDHVLGSQQWFDPERRELYSMSYSLQDSFARIADPARPVQCRIFRHKIDSSDAEEIWSGEMADYMHDIIVNKDRRYCVVCELGMYLDDEKNIIPSKALVVDLKSGKQWTLDRFIVAAHAQFDPEDPEVVYFSNHNFQFEHSSIPKLLKKASYTVKFRGPAAVYKYRLTADGPREIGVFTRPDFYRLTNMHVFLHRGRKVMAAMGFPDEVFLVDAEDMSFIRKIQVDDPGASKSGKRALIGTISPSPDGETLFVQTARSFQAVDVASGSPQYVRECSANHSCSNHMLASSDTSWK